MSDSGAGYRWLGPDQPQVPVILSVPHAGRDYTDVAPVALYPQLLWRLEDCHADLLIAAAVAGGASAIVATRPRAFIDLNRDEGDLDWEQVEGRSPCPLSPRAATGLGLIPRRLSTYGDLWRRRLGEDELAARLAFRRAYYRRLDDALDDAVARFGGAVLLDVHSMPSLAGARPPDLVLGDRFGLTASRETTSTIERLVRASGLRVVRNEPYAGGAIVTHAGTRRPAVEALQLEIARPLYLDRAGREPGPGLARTQLLIAAIVRTLADLRCAPEVPLAAE